MAKLKINWQQITSDESIRRSSQVIGVHEGKLAIFGGELKPRKPVDNKLYIVPLSGGVQTKETSNPPTPRVGSAAATLGGKTYIFSGRAGLAMTPMNEQGILCCLDHAAESWSPIPPANESAPVPPPRSYHCLTSDGRDTLYLHAGCPEKERLSDLWAFQISTRRWIQLADAPGAQRGGASITFCSDTERLYRMNGFDGKNEQGGAVDIYNPEMDTWTSKPFNPDGVEGPEARSVSALLTLKLAGQPWIVTLFGERDPSSLGHAGAGKMLGDVWAFDPKSETWTKAEASGSELPVPRGWFAADVVGEDKIIVHGGLNEQNERLGDVWVGTLSVSE